MLFTKLSVTLLCIRPRSLSSAANSSALFFGFTLSLLILLSNSSYKCSIGLRSGLWEGHSSESINFDSFHLLALPCGKGHCHLEKYSFLCQTLVDMAIN